MDFKRLLQEANKQDLINFILDYTESINDEKLKKDLYISLYKNIFGSTFTKLLLDEVFKGCKQEDLITLDETNKIIKEMNLGYNPFEFNYIMNINKNMILLTNDLEQLIKYSSIFLNDTTIINKTFRYLESIS